MSVVCCQVEASATGWSLVQRVLSVSECDREASILRGPWPTGGCCAIGRKLRLIVTEYNVVSRESNIHLNDGNSHDKSDNYNTVLY